MNAIGIGIRNILAKVAMILPDDPIVAFLADLTRPAWMGYLNYFVPISILAEITKGWCLCIVLYRIFVYAKRKGTSFFSVLGGNGN